MQNLFRNSRPTIMLPLLALVGFAAACGDQHLPARGPQDYDIVGKREYPQFPLTPPNRPLEWGDINVIHTTDTHGWLLGHQKASWPEPNYRWVFSRQKRMASWAGMEGL